MVRPAQTLFAAAVAIVVGCAISCGSPGAAPLVFVADAAPPYIDSGLGFAQSACGACLGKQCATTASTCVHDPTCARWLGCVGECAVAETGDVDADCAAACPAPEGSAALEARDHHVACVQRARPSPCSCGDKLPAVASLLAQTCPKSEAENVCQRCIEERTCETSDRCLVQDGCRQLKMCVTACGSDVDCEHACYAQYPKNFVAYEQALWARIMLCSAPELCNDTGWTEQAACGFRACGVERMECQSDLDCVLLADCVLPCTTADCTLACTTRYPRGTRLHDALQACNELRCLVSK